MPMRLPILLPMRLLTRLPMLVRRLVRVGIVMLMGAVMVSCGDKVAPPLAPGSSLVALRIDAGPAFQQAPQVSFIDVHVFYTRLTGTRVSLLRERIPIGAVNLAQQLSVTVDIAPCVTDPDHPGPATGCALMVGVAVLDANESEIDSRELGPIAVTPGAPPAAVSATLTSRYTLSVTKAGLGSGNVTFAPAASTASGGLFLAKSTVTLTAVASATSLFTGWSGACTGTNPLCAVQMTSDKSATATFDTTYAIAVTNSGNGGGSVTAAPAGPRYAPGTSVTLTATPVAGSVFSGWSGACTGTASACTLLMNGNKSVTASFDLIQNFTITVTKTGNGNGTVTMNPAAASYPTGSVVTLTATASQGSAFVNWSGDCTGTLPVCSLLILRNKSVTAQFTTTTTTYDGTYTGSYGGDDTGPVRFTVSNGVITVTQPGSGSGSVNSSGSATFAGSVAAAGCNASFTGSFSVSGNNLSANGTWTCSGFTGTWSATGTRSQ